MAAPPENLWRDIRTLPRPAWILFAGSFINRFGSFVTVVLVLYLVLAPPHLRGRYQGAFNLTFAIGFVLAPALGTRLYDRSPGALWLVCGLLGIVSGAMILGSRRLRARPELALPEAGPDMPGTPR